MRTLAARAAKFVRNVRTDIASCQRGLDKVAVAVADARRVIAVLLESIAGVRPTWALRPFPLRDVEIVNRDGRFLCRRGTSDYSIARPDFERALRPLFNLDRGVFLDIGAHMGKYTVLVGRQLGARGRVVAIEPDPDNIAALRRNIAVNGLDNVIALNVACGNAYGDATLHRDPHETMKHSLRGEGAGIPVPMRRLDALLWSVGITEVDLMKIDVERMELEVLEGAVDLLRRSRSIRIVFESEDDRAVMFLRSHGFQITRTEHSFGTTGWYYVATRGNTGGPDSGRCRFTPTGAYWASSTVQSSDSAL